MCVPKTPSYTEPPSYATEKQPDNAALYEAATQRAAERGGGAARSTVRTSLTGLQSKASATRGSSVLG